MAGTPMGVGVGVVSGRRAGVVKPSPLPRRAREAMARGVRPVKGGDGGTAVDEALLHGGSLVHDRDNAKRSITCAVRCRTLLIPTSDPCDVAHSQRDEAGKNYLPQMVNAGRGRLAVRGGLRDCPPRLYPPSQLVGTGREVVGIDSMFDGLHERRVRLARDGAELHVRVGAISTAAAAERWDASLPGGMRLRDVLHQRTSEAMTREERELELAGSAWLRKHG